MATSNCNAAKRFIIRSTTFDYRGQAPRLAEAEPIDLYVAHEASRGRGGGGIQPNSLALIECASQSYLAGGGREVGAHRKGVFFWQAHPRSVVEPTR